MLSMEKDSKAMAATNWKKATAVVACTATVAAVAFVGVNSSQKASLNASLMTVPEDFYGEFVVSSNDDSYNMEGVFHKYEKEDGDWHVDAQTSYTNRGDPNVYTSTIFDNVWADAVYKNNKITDLYCRDFNVLEVYGLMKDSLENAVSMESGNVEYGLKTEVEAQCGDGAASGIVQYNGINYAGCVNHMDEHIIAKAYSKGYKVSMRSNPAVEDVKFEHDDGLKLLNCSQFNPRKHMMDVLEEHYSGENPKNSRQLSHIVTTDSWPFTNHRVRSLNEYEDLDEGKNDDGTNVNEYELNRVTRNFRTAQGGEQGEGEGRTINDSGTDESFTAGVHDWGDHNSGGNASAAGPGARPQVLPQIGGGSFYGLQQGFTINREGLSTADSNGSSGSRCAKFNESNDSKPQMMTRSKSVTSSRSVSSRPRKIMRPRGLRSIPNRKIGARPNKYQPAPSFGKPEKTEREQWVVAPPLFDKGSVDDNDDQWDALSPKEQQFFCDQNNALGGGRPGNIEGGGRPGDTDDPNWNHLKREKAYGFENMRCYLFHGIGGVGNEADGPTMGPNATPYGNVNHTVYKNPAYPEFRPYTLDANGNDIFQTSATGAYTYWESMESTFHEAGLGAACDQIMVYDADTVNQGYDNKKVMQDACDMYLDGDDWITVYDYKGNFVSRTANPLHAVGYAHPHDHKIVITHSMGGMYTSKNFATQNCQKKLPTSVVLNVGTSNQLTAAQNAGYAGSVTGTVMETTYLQSQPPMDGSKAAEFNIMVCRGFPKWIARLENVANNILKFVAQIAWMILKALCFPLYVILKAVWWIFKKVTGYTMSGWMMPVVEKLINKHAMGVLANSCYTVKEASQVPEDEVRKLFWPLDLGPPIVQEGIAVWDGRDAFYSIARGAPSYYFDDRQFDGRDYQTQDNYHAEERMCGTSPWGTGGQSGMTFKAIAWLAGLQAIWRDICIVFVKYPCKCSWRGCATCEWKKCLFKMPSVSYNDGAVSMDSCKMWGEGSHFTYLAINHDDGTFRNKDGDRADQQPLRLFTNFVRKARHQTLLSESKHELSMSALIETAVWFHRKADQIVPPGDRDGSFIWSAVEKAGSYRPTKMTHAFRNKTETYNRMYTFDETVSKHQLHYGTVGVNEYYGTTPLAIKVQNIKSTDANGVEAEEFLGEVDLLLNSVINVDVPVGDTGYGGNAYAGMPGGEDCEACGGWDTQRAVVFDLERRGDGEADSDSAGANDRGDSAGQAEEFLGYERRG